MSCSQSAISRLDGVSTPWGVVSIRAITVFVPVVAMYACERISDLGMRHFSP